MNKIINKRNITILLAMLSLVIYIFTTKIGFFGVCNGNFDCATAVNKFFESLFVVFPLVPLAFLLNFMRDRIFWIWLSFSCVWLPYAIYLAYSTGSGNFALPSGPAVTAYFLSIFYALASLIFILALWLFLRFKDRNNHAPKNQ